MTNCSSETQVRIDKAYKNQTPAYAWFLLDAYLRTTILNLTSLRSELLHGARIGTSSIRPLTGLGRLKPLVTTPESFTSLLCCRRIVEFSARQANCLDACPIVIALRTRQSTSSTTLSCTAALRIHEDSHNLQHWSKSGNAISFLREASVLYRPTHPTQ